MAPIRNTVNTAAVMNVATATSDRGDSRASPTTPWPLVQPEPIREPKPTSRPAMMSSGVEAWIVTAGHAPAISR